MGLLRPIRAPRTRRARSANAQYGDEVNATNSGEEALTGGNGTAEPRGRNEKGQLVVEYIPGDLAMPRCPLDTSLLPPVGALVRSIHTASLGLPDQAETRQSPKRRQ